MRYLGITILCFLFSILALSAQEDNSKYRTIKVNGKVHTFKVSLEKDYPYDVEMIAVTGDTINSSKVLKTNGKPTVLLFWMTTCVPCQFELDNIHKKYAEWQKEADFNLYAISQELPKYASRFAPYVHRKKWEFEAYYDFNRVFRRIMPEGLNGLPQTFILDKNGKIVYHRRKYRMGDEDLLFEEVKALSK
ncbi:MAG: TlpA disulfide reductase family protein [Bacteroidota bacterium]